MTLMRDGAAHLTYCSNIHPAEDWPRVLANLRQHVPEIKRVIAPDRSFGLGLRLSARAATELEQDDAMEEMQTFLGETDCYVFTLNGFPYGAFHGQAVKERVYRPDWRTDERLGYTNRLARVLARLLPDGPDMEGSISTVPGAYKSDIAGDADLFEIAERLIRHVAYLVDLKWHTGRTIVLGLEAEAGCLLETTDDTVRFFAQYVHAEWAAERLSLLTGLSDSEAHEALKLHLGICLDLCHLAIQFETIGETVEKLEQAGIRVAKVQISAALSIDDPGRDQIDSLRRLDDGVYLHQVVVRGPEGIVRYPDIAPAVTAKAVGPGGDSWRVHFHVPIHLRNLGPLATTSESIRDFLAVQRDLPISRHLEIETYTWDVLPAEYRATAVTENIVKEMEWLIRQSAD